MQYQDLPDHILVKCEGRMTVHNIAEQKKILQEVLTIKKPIHFDLANLVDIDTASIQLLFSFSKTLKQVNLQCKWLNQSNAFREVIQLLGMDKLLCQ